MGLIWDAGTAVFDVTVSGLEHVGKVASWPFRKLFGNKKKKNAIAENGFNNGTFQRAMSTENRIQVDKYPSRSHGQDVLSETANALGGLIMADDASSSAVAQQRLNTVNCSSPPPVPSRDNRRVSEPKDTPPTWRVNHSQPQPILPKQPQSVTPQKMQVALSGALAQLPYPSAANIVQPQPQPQPEHKVGTDMKCITCHKEYSLFRIGGNYCECNTAFV